MANSVPDLTVIFLTVNKVPEHWRLFHRKVLLDAVGNYPLITVSRTSMPDMPGLNLIQDGSISALNVYAQMYRALRHVTTPYFAIAEDDSLYPWEHFHTVRPTMDTFGFNATRWSLYEWREPMYSWRDRLSNLTMVAPTELGIRCLRERFDRYHAMFTDGVVPDWYVGELGKLKIQDRLALPHYNIKQWHTDIAVLNINHQYSMDDRELRKVKKPGPLRAYDIPYWGHAAAILSQFK